MNNRKKSKIKAVLQVAALVLLCLVIHNRWVVPRISMDQMRQLVAVENLVRGNGVTYDFISKSAGDEVVLHNSFPMGYYALVAPFHAVFGDAILIHRVLELAGLLIAVYQLFLLGKWVGREFNFDLAPVAIMVFSLVQLNPWRASGFTDLWAMAMLLMALRMVLTSNRLGTKTLIWIGVVSFSTIFLRYAYYPLAFVPVLLCVFKIPGKNLRKFLPTLILVGLVVVETIMDRIFFDGITHIESQFDQKRWFFSHLAQMDPVGFNAFFSDHVIFGALGLERWGVNTHWPAKYLVLAVSFFILFLMGFAAFKSMHSQKVNFRDSDQLLFSTVALVVLVNVGFISAISVYYPSKSEDYLYTWQLISRYFAPSCVMLQLYLVLLTHTATGLLLKRAIRGLLIASAVFQVGYLGSFLARFSPTDVWGNYVQFYGRTEMPEVMENYKKLLCNPDLTPDLPDSHLRYEYMSIYYLTGSERMANYFRERCPDCRGVGRGVERGGEVE